MKQGLILMSEKQVIVTLEDGFGRVQTKINTELSAPQLMDNILEIDEQQDTIGEQKIAIDELIVDYKKLEKENEQLQKELEKVKLLNESLLNGWNFGKIGRDNNFEEWFK